MTEKYEYCSTVPRTLSRIVAMGKWRIGRFHPPGQHLCKFIGTKESVGIRKAAVSLFWDTNMMAVKSCDNTLFRM